MTRRSYEQHCGLARALEVVGERWTLLIVRELVLGPKRFTDLAQRLPGMARNLLAERLRQLVADGVVERSERHYSLTPLGEDLRPAAEALAVWGMRLLEANPSARTVNPSWLALSMRAGGDPTTCNGINAVCELRIGGEQLVLGLGDGEVDLREGKSPTPPDTIIECEVDAFFALGSGAITVDAAKASGQVRIHGDPDLPQVCFQVLRVPPYPAMESRRTG